jgi:protein N-terminal methyltransferase
MTTQAKDYYSNVPGNHDFVLIGEATVDGMLGGYGRLDRIDILASRAFLKPFLRSDQTVACGNRNVGLRLDCGAGIGRVTKGLLVPLFQTIDLVEQNPDFLKEAKETILKDDLHKIGEWIPLGIQDFVPEKKYDVIWIQWVLTYLNDGWAV